MTRVFGRWSGHRHLANILSDPVQIQCTLTSWLKAWHEQIITTFYKYTRILKNCYNGTDYLQGVVEVWFGKYSPLNLCTFFLYLCCVLEIKKDRFWIKKNWQMYPKHFEGRLKKIGLSWIDFSVHIKFLGLRPSWPIGLIWFWSLWKFWNQKIKNKLGLSCAKIRPA